MTEMCKLHELLEKAEIPHEYHFKNGETIYYKDDKDQTILTAVCNTKSQGYEKGLLEIVGLLSEDEEYANESLGYQTAEAVFRRIRKHFKLFYENHLHQ